jgi:hypothetical protein
MDPLTPVTSEQHVLEKLKVVSQIAVSRSVLPAFVRDNARFEVGEANPVLDQLIFRLRSAVLADKLVSERQAVTLDIPASWWQHFKRDSWLGRHRPQWMRRRWPVRFTTMRQEVLFERYRTYPDASIALPSERFGAPVIYETYTPMGWKS